MPQDGVRFDDLDYDDSLRDEKEKRSAGDKIVVTVGNLRASTDIILTIKNLAYDEDSK